jgi:acetylglutamate kinase
MVLVGRVNKSIVSLIQQAGGSAVGLCGKDAGMIKARARNFEELGFVGDVTAVDISIIMSLVRASTISLLLHHCSCYTFVTLP